jgi:serine phosphatase RsbU (regulator of sigma subunit)
MLIKSIVTKKIYVHFVSLVLALCAVFFGLAYILEWVTFSWVQVLILTAVVFVLAVLVYYVDFVVPMTRVLDQVKAILTGRRYKKIYSDRTDEIGIFAHFFNELTGSLEKVTDELDQSHKVTGELKTAGQLQKELIPTLAPTIEGFDIAVKNRSAEELGGDNLDFIKVKNSTYFYVGDVTGHGVPAAIVMTMVNTLINTYAELYESAYEVVVQTNRRLKTRIRATMFMSMLMLKWNSMTKKMTYVGCGHEHLIIYKAKTGKVEAIVSGGIALGMVADNSKIVKEKDVELETGDVIVLYTDGITEARNMKGEMFGLKRVIELVTLYGAQGGASEIIENMAKDFSRFVEEHVQEDDVTLIVVKKLEDGAASNAVIDQKQERWTGELEQK